MGESDKGKYEFLYHIADAKFRAYGSTQEEAFENAALAMFNVMIDTSNMEATEERELDSTSTDIKMLLVEWLSELLYLFEVDNIIFSRFMIDSIEKSGEMFCLKGKAWGVPVDITRHTFDTQVKAVTFHELEVGQDETGRFFVQVVADT